MHRAAIAAALTMVAMPALGDEVRAAVAANFAGPAEELAAAFGASSGHRVILSFGATGQLYAQIAQGAPFDVFLAGDAERPARAVAEGLALAGSVFTYAVGTLVLYAPGQDMGDDAAVLEAGGFAHLAIADPATAPYGKAAMEVIDGLGLAAGLGPRIVTGGSVAQALQFVESGNAELGFVALSQVLDRPAGEVWRVPADRHAPIRQDAVLAAAGARNGAAWAFLEFLRGDTGRAIIESHGYGAGPVD